MAESETGEAAPAWAPDGKAVAFAGRRAGYDILLERVPGLKP